jgi:hypothetical protein
VNTHPELGELKLQFQLCVVDAKDWLVLEFDSFLFSSFSFRTKCDDNVVCVEQNFCSNGILVVWEASNGFSEKP